jgi:threonine dehydrogenase-like Zn-dependent dehydrogenase
MGTHPVEVNPEYKGRGDGSTMKALAWFGTNDVRLVEAPIPDITEPDDVILAVTGTTICGSDLHLYHGEILALQKGDILGHEVIRVPSDVSISSTQTLILQFMGKVDHVGPNVTKFKPGDRVVASFQIACGKCEYCQKKLSSFCDRTNNSS